MNENKKELTDIERFNKMFLKYHEDFDKSPIKEVYDSEEGIDIDFEVVFYEKAIQEFDNFDEVAGTYFNKILSKYLKDMEAKENPESN